MTHAGELPLHLLSGVPVIELAGEWGESEERLLTQTIRSLAQAGHCEIIISLAHVATRPEEGAAWRERAGRIGKASGRRVRFEWAGLPGVGGIQTEEQAVCRLKGVMLAPSGTRLTAHLTH